MISKYLKSKNIISQIKPLLDKEELEKDFSDGFWYLSSYDHQNKFFYYNNLFSDEEIKNIITICQNLKKEHGILGGENSSIEEVQKIRKSTISWVPINDYTEWIYRKLTDCILEMNQKYFKYDLDKIERLQFTRYDGDSKGFYKPHLDTNTSDVPSNRKLSFVLQLSDPSEYDGGELNFYLGPEKTTVKKERGLITFFPSSMLHECSNVTSGTRFVIVGWVYGPPFR
jgi:PKHD-type hydroxylase